MVRLDLQLFGGRGSGSGGNGGDLLGKEGSATDVHDIKDMISERGTFQREADEVLTVARRMNGLFGSDGTVTQFQTASMRGALAYYDSDGNIAMNRKYMNSRAMDSAYDASGGFHPSRGSKSGIQAVASHEYGHALADRAARRLGARDLEAASRTIVERARAKTGHKTNLSFARNISGYAAYNFAECVAEAVSDWHCNGSKARRESRAVMAVLSNILRH